MNLLRKSAFLDHISLIRRNTASLLFSSLQLLGINKQILNDDKEYFQNKESIII